MSDNKIQYQFPEFLKEAAVARPVGSNPGDKPGLNTDFKEIDTTPAGPAVPSQPIDYSHPDNIKRGMTPAANPSKFQQVKSLVKETINPPKPTDWEALDKGSINNALQRKNQAVKNRGAATTPDEIAKQQQIKTNIKTDAINAKNQHNKQFNTPKINPVNPPSGGTGVPNPTPSGGQFGFKAFGTDVNKMFGSYVQGKGDLLKNSINNLSTKHLGESGQKLVSNVMQTGGLFDKGVGLVAKHGLKFGAGVGAGIVGKGLWGAAKGIIKNPALASIAIPAGIGMASKLLQGKGRQGVGEVLEQNISPIKKMLKTSSEADILESFYDDEFKGYKSIDEKFSESETKTKLAYSEVDLMRRIAPHLQESEKEALLEGLTTIRKKSDKEKLIDMALAGTFGIGTGVVSNFLTDAIRRTGNNNPNKPTIILTSGRKAEILHEPNMGLDNIKFASIAAKTTEVIQDTAKEITKVKQKGLKRILSAKNPIGDTLAQAAHFANAHPLATAFGAGVVTSQLGPSALDMTTRGIGSSYNYMNNQYNNLAYGYNNPYGGYNGMGGYPSSGMGYY